MRIQFIRPTGQRSIRLSFLVLVVVGAVMVSEESAWAQFGGSCGCPVIVSDPEMYGRQGAQLAQETRMADVAAQNTAGGDSGTWQSQFGLLSGLGGTMMQSGGLCYATPNAAQQFRVDFPGAVPPPVNAAQHMQQLASITLGTLGGALGVAQQQASHFQYEDQEFAALEAKNAGVTGRLQAIQVSNEILLVQAQQLQLLRQLLITLINAESVYHGARLSTDVQAAAQASQFLSAGGTGQ